MFEQEPANQNVHIVLESAPHTEKYFHKYFLELKKTMNMYNISHQKDYKVSTITSNNHYSLAAFLHASDFSDEKIEEEIWKIKNLIQINSHINEKFSSNNWCKTNKLRMRELEEEVWSNRDAMFKLIEKELN